MNNKTAFIIGAAALLIVATVAGLWVYNAVLGETEPASSPIAAVPLEAGAATPVPELVVVEPTAASQAESGLVLFEISQADSQASFSIYEELAGQPKTVVGTTDQVAGQIAIDLSDLSQAQVGVIQVNARTFVTDSDRRNNAIRRFILSTDQYEFITFTPTEIIGLSGSAEPGQPVSFQIAGDLTIRDVTQPVVFEVTAQGDSATQLTGTATTVVTRSAFNLTIPSVPNVANVGDEVTLTIDFVAQAAG